MSGHQANIQTLINRQLTFFSSCLGSIVPKVVLIVPTLKLCRYQRRNLAVARTSLQDFLEFQEFIYIMVLLIRTVMTAVLFLCHCVQLLCSFHYEEVEYAEMWRCSSNTIGSRLVTTPYIRSQDSHALQRGSFTCLFSKSSIFCNINYNCVHG